MSFRPLLVTLLAAAVATAGCAGNTSRDVLLVSAAASLTDAFNGIALAFESDHTGVDVQLNFAGSSSLREQVLGGAPADVVATANPDTMAPLVDADLTTSDPLVFARNRMAVAVPSGNLAGVSGLEDLADPTLLIGLCDEAVPCGSLARAILLRAGITAAIDTNEPDVRSLLTKLEADELDAGIVYITDVIATGDGIEGIAIADAINLATDYPIAALRSASDPQAAEEFVDFVLSTRGRDILARHGFELP